MSFRRTILVLALSVTFARATPIDFTKDIRPILEKTCISCHGESKQKGGLRLDAREPALKGGDDGVVIVPHHAADSLLVQYVSGSDPDKRMPPKGDPLSPQQIATVKNWIEQGAKWPTDANTTIVISDKLDHWAYKAIAPVSPPAIASPWIRNPIDAFVLAKLIEKNLSPAPETDKSTLLRRVTFDLTGLPPTAEELHAFLADNSQNAYEKVVDRLLASPRYGERWARRWMDLCHFAESHGDDQDRERPNAWPYRDYLIRSFNSDKPFAKFIEEQIAGDALFPDDPQATVALGFMAAGPWDESSQMAITDDSVDKAAARNLDRDDMVSTAITTFTSTTIHCARCHNHKFDPITQQDYYGLQAVFAGVDRAERPYGPKWMKGPFVYAITNDFKPNQNFKPAKTPRPVFVLKRGEVTQPMEPATPGALAFIPGLSGQFELKDPQNESSRRAALAKWLADPRNCLTWRSIVNRAWQYHFGRGIVSTANDFGHMGAAPTHPQLLDWLAARFRDGGGSIKSLDRLLVTTSTYRQSTRHNPTFAERDADNRFLWRMNRTRLDAECIRDSILQISGLLDTTMGGPSARQFIQKQGVQVTPVLDYAGFDPDNPAMRRLSIYRFIWRTVPDPFMDALDYPDGSQLTAQRSVSITPLQALAMMNNRFVVRYSQHIAERLKKERPTVDAQIVRAFELCLSRNPTDDESATLGAFTKRHGLPNACRMILNSSEFIFVN